MKKINKYHHSITELGTLQVRLITEIQDDNGNVISKKMSESMTPADTNNMQDWDNNSIALVEAVKDAQDDFKKEKQVKTGKGLEEIITYDRVVEDDGKIAVRKIARIYDDGKEVSKKYHRSWIMPGDDPEPHDAISKAVAKKIHTKEVKAKFKVKQKAIA